MVFIILGMSYHPFYYAFLLTFPVIRSNILLSVLNAIWVPKFKILWTICFLIIIVYFLTLFTYWHFSEDYNLLCQDLRTCLLVTLDQTFKNDGGVGNFLNIPYQADQANPDVRYGRIAYDNFFNLLVLILIVQILAGIIIDKFSELRENDERRLADQYSECFICGQTRETLDKHSFNGFNQHINF